MIVPEKTLIKAIGILLFFGSLMAFLAGYGLLTLKSWGYKLTVIIFGLNALGDIGHILRGEAIKGLVGVIIVSLLLRYLLKKSIRALFSKTKQ